MADYIIKNGVLEAGINQNRVEVYFYFNPIYVVKSPATWQYQKIG